MCLMDSMDISRTNQEVCPTQFVRSNIVCLDFQRNSSPRVCRAETQQLIHFPIGKYTPKYPYVLPNANQFYTYHPTPSANGTTQIPIPPTAINLKPFYADPSSYIDLPNQRLNAATILSAIVDPFTPIHLYSALLPIKTLTIPHFAVSGGLNNIATFFRTGPILLDEPLPSYDEGKRVKQDYRLDDQTKAPTANGEIGVPGVSLSLCFRSPLLPQPRLIHSTSMDHHTGY